MWCVNGLCDPWRLWWPKVVGWEESSVRSSWERERERGNKAESFVGGWGRICMFMESHAQTLIGDTVYIENTSQRQKEGKGRSNKHFNRKQLITVVPLLLQGDFGGTVCYKIIFAGARGCSLKQIKSMVKPI